MTARRERVLRWLPLLVVPLEAGLIVAVLAGVAVPPLVRVGVGVAVGVAVALESARLLRSYRRHRRTGSAPWPACRAALLGLLPAPVTAVLAMEWRVWRGLVRGVLRRPDVPAGAVGFTHHRALAPVRWICVTLLLLEIAVVHLIVPAGIVRLVLLVLGLYSAVWVLGYLLGSGAVRPHLVGPDAVVLRCGLTTDITVPLDVIAQARVARHGKAGTATIQLDGPVLSLVDNGGTNVELRLMEPLRTSLPRGRSADATEIRVWVDDPAALTGCILRARPALAGPQPAPRRADSPGHRPQDKTASPGRPSAPVG